MNEAVIGISSKPAFLSRIWQHPFIRAVVGVVLTFAPLPLVMILAHALVPKPFRVIWPQLLAAALSFLAYRFFAHRIEKRALTEFDTRGAMREAILGLPLGAGLVCAVFALLGLFGVYHLNGLNAVSLDLVRPIAELLLVGLTEEMIFRGIVFRIADESLCRRWAIMISALVFTAAHLPNEGISLVPIAALAAYGVMQAAIYIRTRRLWLCIANHFAWNYCVGQVFSATVSGHGAESGLLHGQLSGPALLTGGVYGVEGSVVTLAVIGVAATCFLLSARTQTKR